MKTVNGFIIYKERKKSLCGKYGKILKTMVDYTKSAISEMSEV